MHSVSIGGRAIVEKEEMCTPSATQMACACSACGQSSKLVSRFPSPCLPASVRTGTERVCCCGWIVLQGSYDLAYSPTPQKQRLPTGCSGGSQKARPPALGESNSCFKWPRGPQQGTEEPGTVAGKDSSLSKCCRK